MTRQLEIIIYGMACFDEQANGNYRVLLPDGRQPGPFRIPPHAAAVWVRGRDVPAPAQWQWPAERNDFTIGAPSKMSITGLNRTPLDKANFRDRLANLLDSDPDFKIDPNPQALVDFTIDRGTLTAHEFPSGMKMAKWMVEADDGAAIRFVVGKNWIEIPEKAQQVIIANAGVTEEAGPSGDSHFLLFRKLSTNKLGQLAPKAPRTKPQLLGIKLQQPSQRYVPRTPRVDCSSVFAH